MPFASGVGQIQQRGNFMKIARSILSSIGLCSFLALSASAQNVPLPYDPLRVVEGKIYSLRPVYDWENLPSTDRSKRPMPEWIGTSNYKFYGLSYRVEHVLPQGLLLRGSGEFVLGGAYSGLNFDQPMIFLTNYPHADRLVDGQTIQFLALRAGSYHYTGSDGAAYAIAEYDYGKPYVPPPLTPEQIKAAQDATKARAVAAKKRAEQGQINAVKWLQPQATNGSPSAQCSLGIHYLNGQGCETNREFAIYWLKKAADQGDLEASNTLAKLQP